MREIVAVCRSSGKSRKRVAMVLDRYLMRIGDRTWRGYASNQCLARISSDLKARATRATAVTVHGFGKSEGAERVLFRVGRRSSFDDAGQAPIAIHGRSLSRNDAEGAEPALRAVVRIAAMFHDLGKSTRLFQQKLRDAIAGRETVPDALRHELVSALAWDALAGNSDLSKISATDIDDAMADAAMRGAELHRRAKAAGSVSVDFGFLDGDVTIRDIGLLILGHHRQPDLSADQRKILADKHITAGSPLADHALDVADGTPFWHEAGWVERLRSEAGKLTGASDCSDIMDLHARTALMLADHYGSSRKQKHPDGGKGHIANSTRDGRSIADSLHRHVERVTDATRSSHDALVACRNGYPGLLETETPEAIRFPAVAGRFGWQGQTAQAAAGLAASGEGGFFACLMAGTGTGKTRAAPTILAAAAFADTRPERRTLRFTLGLGLRVLATQSGTEYVEDLGFTQRDVSVMVGSPPIEFRDEEEPGPVTGSGDMLSGLDPVDVIRAGADVPEEGADEEADWLLGLSHDVDRKVPAFIDMLAKEDDKFSPGRGAKLRKLVGSPILCATVDNVIAAASPERSRHLAAAVRVITSDLILDEVDQYSAEDISVVARLAYLTGAAGRRLIIMSATVTPRIACALHDAYREGWAAHARAFGLRDHVHALCASDASGSLFTSLDGDSFEACLEKTRSAVIQALEAAPARRRAEPLLVGDLESLPVRVSERCSEMHDRHAVEIEGFRVSVGFVRATRIQHTVNLAAHLPDAANGRIRAVVCLHSRFTRLGRGWIERELKAALTRKGSDPHRGIREMCRKEGLFKRARAVGACDIELVLICSPVIETGNDLDFDYAILDPSSSRSVVQAAGRVRRHRDGAVTMPNIAIFDVPLVTLEGRGRLEMPGVETASSGDTGVRVVNLDHLVEARTTAALFGEVACIDARMILDPAKIGRLQEAEDELVSRFLGELVSIGDWTRSGLRRHGCRQSAARRFRRNTSRKIVAWQDGESLADLTWYWDRLPGRFDPQVNRALADGISPMPGLRNALFLNLTDRAWKAAFGEKEVSSHRARRVLSIDVQVYGDAALQDPELAYHETLGLARPFLEDLSET